MMNLEALRARTLAQVGAEAEELAELQPQVDDYINEGYRDMLLRAYKPRRTESVCAQDGRVAFSALKGVPIGGVGAFVPGLYSLTVWIDEDEKCVRVPAAPDGCVLAVRYRYLPRALSDAEDTPIMPEWTHNALADWATWRLYTNGNPHRQNRGQAFRARYEEVLRQVKPMGALEPGAEQFHGLYAGCVRQ